MIEHILFKITEEEEEEEDQGVALDAPPFGEWAHKIKFRTFRIAKNDIYGRLNLPKLDFT